MDTALLIRATVAALTDAECRDLMFRVHEFETSIDGWRKALLAALERAAARREGRGT